MNRLVTWLVIIMLAIVFGIIVFAVVSRSGDDNEVAIGSNVRLACTQACADRGQCGILQSEPGVQVVLGGLDHPEVEAGRHTVYFPVNVELQLRETRTEAVQEVISQNTFQEVFWRVERRNSAGDFMGTGWIADWCLEQPR